MKFLLWDRGKEFQKVLFDLKSSVNYNEPMVVWRSTLLLRMLWFSFSPSLTILPSYWSSDVEFIIILSLLASLPLRASVLGVQASLDYCAGVFLFCWDWKRFSENK